MDVILIPGLWLDATSWAEVAPALERAGHRVHALTMPGVGAPAAQSAQIGIADWVAAAVREVDAITGKVVVVGHSGGGNVAWGVADARPDAVARVIFVDTAPPAPGFGISEFPIEDGVVHFPGWDFFDDEDVYDLDSFTRERTLAFVRDVPQRVPADRLSLQDEARFDVPVTLLMGRFDRDELLVELAQWGPFEAEFRRIRDSEVIRIDSGHWPQFTMPERLAAFITEAIER